MVGQQSILFFSALTRARSSHTPALRMLLPGAPTASLQGDAIKRLWPTGRRATSCRRLTTAETTQRRSSLWPQQAPVVSLLVWEAMTGEHPQAGLTVMPEEMVSCRTKYR